MTKYCHPQRELLKPATGHKEMAEYYRGHVYTAREGEDGDGIPQDELLELVNILNSPAVVRINDCHKCKNHREPDQVGRRGERTGKKMGILPGSVEKRGHGVE